jgi:hypothetical protein
MVLIFIDGPLVSEVRAWCNAPLTFEVFLPKRITTCYCHHDEIDDEIGDEYKIESDIVSYYRIAVGELIGIYSIAKDEEKIVQSLKQWIITDMTASVWRVTCRDRRAFK